MEISGLTGLNPAGKVGEGNNRPKAEEKNHERFSSVAAKFEHVEIDADLAAYSKKGEIPKVDVPKPEANINDIGETAKLKSKIHKEVLDQVRGFLTEYFEANPEDAIKVENGEIPEYFNVENTASRILDIYFAHYEEGEDKSAFVERAKGIINEAYGDVGAIVENMPEIVLETKQRVMEILDRFAAGEDITDYLSNKLNDENI